ncbi:major facilitator superfamily MFS_1 [Arcobacter nitrofigilis DSM 7299]|uniref:Major facilitator superfamily MFS_1 n=1 Tax=Arcobacter nitrofigilis (strain ATCC 33309 / DSM 7299 / CCUG 15893 / LMG 7604 / NCTC 12251 / CI) TaxID=572480 RepID=D5V7D7_ARCNC|nr:MFS transporter [Arcobacter nitrofigilis]ADG94557.1 major facilitator superfamily MFS_1 [Arcobacter nitrofigilis DSM 7299]
MKTKELFIIIYNIVVVLSVMYATQPLQPLLAKEFEVSIVKSSQFTAVIMLFLAIAPIIYGYILERVNAKRVLLTASLILAVTNTFLSFSTSYEMFLTIRTIEAIVIPAILTASMSILANIDKVNVKLNMSIYVASTVFGGLVGRVFSGYIATYFSWQMVFLSLSFASLIGLFLITRLNYDAQAHLTKATIKDISQILKDKRFFVIYLLMFSIFFVFAGVLNILPFRLKELDPSTSESQIGLLYLGYGVGIVVSLFIHKIIKFFDKEMKTILFGIIIFLISTALYIVENPLIIFLNVFLFCLGMFTVHTVSTRMANSLKESQKSLTSGMYLSFYYIGGTVGSIIPPMFYQLYGWNNTIYLCMFLLCVIFIFVYTNRKIFKAYN